MDFSGHSYKYFSNLTVTARDARDACMAEGGLLVSINNDDEMDFLIDSVLRRRTLSGFIGGTDEEEGNM